MTLETHIGTTLNEIKVRIPPSVDCTSQNTQSMVLDGQFLELLFIFDLHRLLNHIYACDCPSNIVDCLRLNIYLTKTYNWLLLANPADKYPSRLCL